MSDRPHKNYQLEWPSDLATFSFCLSVCLSLSLPLSFGCVCLLCSRWNISHYATFMHAHTHAPTHTLFHNTILRDQMLCADWL